MAQELPGAARSCQDDPVPPSSAEQPPLKLKGVQSRESEALAKVCNKSCRNNCRDLQQFYFSPLSLVLGVVLCVLCIEDGLCCGLCDSGWGCALCVPD